MDLNLGRIGPLLSDRLVLGEDGTIDSLHADNTFWGWIARIISWIWNPSSYSEENRKAIACVKKYLVDVLGEERLKRLQTRCDINLDKLERDGDALYSRKLADIFVKARDRTIDDVEELIQISKEELEKWLGLIPVELRVRLQGVANSSELDSATFAEVVDALAPPEKFSIPEITDEIKGMAPTEYCASFFFDQMLADRERMELCKENPNDDQETFYHNFTTRIIGREMKIGTLVRGPNHPDGRAQYYVVSGKLVTGEGMVGYILKPTTQDTNLKPFLDDRGTNARPSSEDAASTVITDFEYELGRTAYESGKIYQAILKRELGTIRTIVGHSLGSTLAQYTIVENPDIEEAYLFNGPGLSDEEVKRFNERMKREDAAPVNLYIRDTNTDSISSVGKKHLGYNSPEKVNINYRRYYPRNGIGARNAHVMVPGRVHRYHGIEGGHDQEEINRLLHREGLPDSKECLRYTIGPCIARIIRWIRDFFRWLLTSRTYLELGLQVGKFEGGRWVTKHIRPEQIEEEPPVIVVNPAAAAG